MKKGFTIVEVSLVLAVAGLIFLMVFITFPVLSAAQRDNTRRDDVARLVGAIANYGTNNRGSIARIGTDKHTSGELRLLDYLDGNFMDPDGTDYEIDTNGGRSGISLEEGGTFTPAEFDHKMYIRTNAECSDEEMKYNSNARTFAVIYRLERAGAYCMSNKL